VNEALDSIAETREDKMADKLHKIKSEEVTK